jgi:hypothetical protein
MAIALWVACSAVVAADRMRGNATAQTGIEVVSARIGCLDIQRAPNLTSVVARACNGRDRCSFQAPMPKVLAQLGVKRATRTACTQAMEITYRCPDGGQKRAFVRGDAWAQPAAPLACGAGGSALTTFDPKVHGFDFTNTFKNIFVGDITTGGLCGGMSYAALDYYVEKQTIPRQDFRPANGTPLQQYVYFRQVHSLERNIDKWGEWLADAAHVRASEFFRWGLQGFAGGRLQELRQALDRGRPVPLGLLNHAQGTPGTHQVLAIGYKLGRFSGTDRDAKWFGDHPEDLEILIYDPNFKNKTMTLSPDIEKEGFYYKEIGKQHMWRAYFVDARYTPAKPSVAAAALEPRDGKARRLLLEIGTVTDLPGGSQNLDVTIDYAGLPDQVVRNVNASQRWLGMYSETVPIELRAPVAPDAIRGVRVAMTGGGRFAIRSIRLRAFVDGESKQLYNRSAGGNATLFAFAPDATTYVAQSEPSGRPTQLVTIESARYGENCGLRAPTSDITRSVADQCNGKTNSCKYTQTWAPWGGKDPSPSMCGKQIAIRYRCGASSQTLEAMHSTTPQDVHLVCR